VTARAPAPDDELLGAQLARLARRSESTEAERRRLVDLYQAGMIELVELQRRAKELDGRRRTLDSQRQALSEERDALAKDNRLRQRISGFADRVTAAMGSLDFSQRQKLLRLVVEEVRVTGWDVEIRLRIPLDERPPQAPSPTGPGNDGGPRPTVSSDDRLRSLGDHHRRQLPAHPPNRRRQHVTTRRLSMATSEDRRWPPARTRTWPLTHRAGRLVFC